MRAVTPAMHLYGSLYTPVGAADKQLDPSERRLCGSSGLQPPWHGQAARRDKFVSIRSVLWGSESVCAMTDTPHLKLLAPSSSL